MRYLVKLLLPALLGTALVAAVVWAQASKYEPTEVQHLRLQVAQKDAIIAQQALQVAQSRFQSAMSSLRDEEAKVKKENGWPADLNMDEGTLAFSEPKVIGKPPAAPAVK